MVGTALVVTALAVFFLRNQMRPIRRLAAAADALGKGRPVTDLKPAGALEIRQAASAFIEMQERIRRQITQRTEMLAGVSHDLRTPLTRMKLQLAMLGNSHPDSDAEIAEFERDIVQMERMIDEYLAFARGQGTEAPISTDLAEIVTEVANGARRKGGQIALDLEQPLVVPLRPNAIKRCLTNLVENAARYGAQIEISATRQNDVVEITIEDDGPGIPEEQREAVFKPFFRLDEARSPNTGGSGLGLAIARDVARGHGGDIRMTSGTLGGLRAELWLPV
jgi:two-component system osmolarity sensor histidine kinase EnvZ